MRKFLSYAAAFGGLVLVVLFSTFNFADSSEAITRPKSLMVPAAAFADTDCQRTPFGSGLGAVASLGDTICYAYAPITLPAGIRLNDVTSYFFSVNEDCHIQASVRSITFNDDGTFSDTLYDDAVVDGASGGAASVTLTADTVIQPGTVYFANYVVSGDKCYLYGAELN